MNYTIYQSRKKLEDVSNGAEKLADAALNQAVDKLISTLVSTENKLIKGGLRSGDINVSLTVGIITISVNRTIRQDE